MLQSFLGSQFGSYMTFALLKKWSVAERRPSVRACQTDDIFEEAFEIEDVQLYITEAPRSQTPALYDLRIASVLTCLAKVGGVVGSILGIEYFVLEVRDK